MAVLSALPFVSVALKPGASYELGMSKRSCGELRRDGDTPSGIARIGSFRADAQGRALHETSVAGKIARGARTMMIVGQPPSQIVLCGLLRR